MITRVKFIGIPVRDQQAQLKFYTEKLGFEIMTDQPLGAQRWIELKIPRAETHVVLFTPEGHEDRVGTFVNASLSCDNVQQTYEELKSRGVEFTQEPTTAPWGTFAKFKDADGNGFVLSGK
jgi:predicted enzyme related to lactoylglutathione lyase